MVPTCKKIPLGQQKTSFGWSRLKETLFDSFEFCTEQFFFVRSRKSISDEKKLWFVFSPLFIGKRNFWSHQRCQRSNESGFHQINLFLKTSALAKNEHKYRSEMLKQRLTNATPLPPRALQLSSIEGSSNLRWSEITRGPRA